MRLGVQTYNEYLLSLLYLSAQPVMIVQTNSTSLIIEIIHLNILVKQDMAYFVRQRLSTSMLLNN